MLPPLSVLFGIITIVCWHQQDAVLMSKNVALYPHAWYGMVKCAFCNAVGAVTPQHSLSCLRQPRQALNAGKVWLL